MGTREESMAQIRRFNRHYVPVMRLLDRNYLDTGMSALETAALIEIGENDGCSARDIAALLHMDKGHLSRAISRFEKRGWLLRETSPEDGRKQILRLSKEGRSYVDELAVKGQGVISQAFQDADDAQLAQVAEAMERILAVLEQES